MSCPCGKRVHAARDAAQRFLSEHPEFEPARAYECPHDLGWHLGTVDTGHGGRIGVTWGDARLVRVTARLRHGAALTGRFPAPLDGILAAVVRRRRLGPAFDPGVIDRRTEVLPLCTSHRGPPGGRPDLGKRWVWAATCAQFPDGTPEDVRWYHKRFRDQVAGRVVGKVPTSTASGRFKDWRLPLVVTLAGELTWWAVGDPERVRDLLADVTQVGKKRSQGEGVVVGWDVIDAGPPEWEPIVWHDGRVARPIPARAAASLGVPGAATVVEQYRPPYFWVPTGEDGEPEGDREVIAPWTAHPWPRAS